MNSSDLLNIIFVIDIFFRYFSTNSESQSFEIFSIFIISLNLSPDMWSMLRTESQTI